MSAAPDISPQISLKRALMLLGNELVTEHGYKPATVPDDDGGPSTRPIMEFTEWLNATPEAVEILAKMGLSWPLSPSRPAPQRRNT